MAQVKEQPETHSERRLKRKVVSGNEALALGALKAGAKVCVGYPGTPSSGAIGSLLNMSLDGRYVEWSINEKVAFEIASGASWAGQRALCTMKMSGLNVAYDSVISVAYSGVDGGLVIYVADDPGVSAGMPEQDTRGFALMSDLPMIEPASVNEAYELIQTAFELSEKTGTPVFFRMVTSTANSHGPIPVEEIAPHTRTAVMPEKDISKYTKAGPAICTDQHIDIIKRLEDAGRLIREMDLNALKLSDSTGGLGVIAYGVVRSYLNEAFELTEKYGLEKEKVSTLSLRVSNPFPSDEVGNLLDHCDNILVLEELEPHLEQRVYVEAQKRGFRGEIIGKIEGPLSRLGEYTLSHVVMGLKEALDLEIPEDLLQRDGEAAELTVARPITVCAGCPHRGTFMAINQGIRKAGFKRSEIMVTGDIGCTILGMNPPFNTLWNEISMGASLGIAQGFVRGGIETPVIATIGDSTFFHAGIPSLINAVQHQTPLTLVIMDNGWTGMTGMQINPGTEQEFQRTGNKYVDIAEMIPGMGVDQFFHMDPFDLNGSIELIKKCLEMDGVKVILARQECTTQAQRRGLKAGTVHTVPENCKLCKKCMLLTGCTGLGFDEKSSVIDPSQCYGCGLCAQVCKDKAIVKGNK